MIKGLDGRPIIIENEHTLLVYMLQSDEAILMQHAVVFLHQWLQDLGWVWGKDYAFVANVHDEFQAEVRAPLVPKYRELAEYSIRYASEYLKMTVPQQGESEAGANWYETH
jgi:DNA polymerase I-like protein with 3'-5' exonuclease and polymerase domains